MCPWGEGGGLFSARAFFFSPDRGKLKVLARVKFNLKPPPLEKKRATGKSNCVQMKKWERKEMTFLPFLWTEELLLRFKQQRRILAVMRLLRVPESESSLHHEEVKTGNYSSAHKV